MHKHYHNYSNKIHKFEKTYDWHVYDSDNLVGSPFLSYFGFFYLVSLWSPFYLIFHRLTQGTDIELAYSEKKVPNIFFRYPVP